jgi:tRNA-dihydrouridine synthase
MKTNSDKKLIKPITINGIKFKSNIFQAPMAGITNYAFRELCKKYKVGLLCSEMISDLGVFHNNEKTIKMIEFSKKQRPISIQLFGNDVKEMTNAALYIEKNFKPDLIDINFGCPAYKVANSKQAGSYLLKTPNKIYEIVKSIKDSIKTPVSAKIRSG